MYAYVYVLVHACVCVCMSMCACVYEDLLRASYVSACVFLMISVARRVCWTPARHVYWRRSRLHTRHVSFCAYKSILSFLLGGSGVRRVGSTPAFESGDYPKLFGRRENQNSPNISKSCFFRLLYLYTVYEMFENQIKYKLFDLEIRIKSGIRKIYFRNLTRNVRLYIYIGIFLVF